MFKIKLKIHNNLQRTCAHWRQLSGPWATQASLSPSCESSFCIEQEYHQNRVTIPNTWGFLHLNKIIACQRVAHCQQMCPPTTPLSNETEIKQKAALDQPITPELGPSLKAILVYSLTPNLSPLARKFTTAPLTLDACTCTGDCLWDPKLPKFSIAWRTSACSPIINIRISSQWVSRTSTRCCLGRATSIHDKSASQPETHLSELMIHLPPEPFFSSSQSGKIPSWVNLVTDVAL